MSPDTGGYGNEPPVYSILVIDDDKIFCDAIIDEFTLHRFKVLTAHNRADGLQACKQEKIDVVLLDQNLPDGEGHLLCPDILKANDETRIIFVTAFPSFENAVHAMKAGAHDYLSKPFEMEQLRLAIHRSLDIMELERVKQRETYRFTKERQDIVLVGQFGKGPDIRNLIKTAAPVDSPVLITGETGTGKNVVAKAIHYTDAREQSPFISINCAALPETLIEAELFGHEKGAFTDARNSRKGIFELAQGGTLFLDEIGDMPLHLQSKLLGVLDEGKIRRLGGQSFIPVKVRVIAATNSDLEEKVRKKTFRRDLYYRLSVLRIHLPPLRERLHDLQGLCDFFIRKMEGGRHHSVTLPESQLKSLEAYSWPGNIRELRNILERSLLLHGNILRPAELLDRGNSLGAPTEAPPQGSTPSPGAPGPGTLKTLAEVEQDYIEAVLTMHGFNLSRSARALGISLSTLKRKNRQYGFKRP